jgi:hypothetical protein
MMPNPHPDRHVQATARLLDSVAHLLPQLRAHLAAERVLADGWPDHVSYALEPDTTEPSSPLTGRCGANVPRGDILVACLRPRPCGEHDAPVGLTPVERAAEAGMRIDRELADIEARLRMIAVTVSGLMVDVQRLGGVRLEKPKRCDAQGRDGAIEWGDPTCTSIQTRGPLCDRCSKREYRWRIDHGLPRRSDGVWSQEGVTV